MYWRLTTLSPESKVGNHNSLSGIRRKRRLLARVWAWLKSNLPTCNIRMRGMSTPACVETCLCQCPTSVCTEQLSITFIYVHSAVSGGWTSNGAELPWSTHIHESPPGLRACQCIRTWSAACWCLVSMNCRNSAPSCCRDGRRHPDIMATQNGWRHRCVAPDCRMMLSKSCSMPPLKNCFVPPWNAMA